MQVAYINQEYCYMHEQRSHILKEWLATVLTKQAWTLTALPGDASFRRYFRLTIENSATSHIVMDAPPAQENIKPFIAIANAFAKLAIHVPQVIATNIEHGFLLLSDLGDDLYLQLLNTNSAEQLYSHALATLQRIQLCQEVSGWTLPHFDKQLLQKEWQLFLQWTVEKHWQLQLTTQDQHLLTNTFEFLAQEFLIQPKVCVHRDYQSRNLMWLKQQDVGVLDFQDAVWGPVTYDALSLLRDCYIDWPEERVTKWCTEYFVQTRENKLINGTSYEQFKRWFDLTTVQRHLKNSGIFTRLNYLYAKPNYLAHLPRTLNYIVQVSEHYPELKKFREFLITHHKQSL